jgi:thioesterase domain-containing protein/acyl carrier protein
MEKLPLTPNGKIDRKALPAPDNNKLETNQGFVEPRDDIEARLVSVWQEVLHVQNIGVRDNFFDAGGYSLLAVRLFSEIKKVFGVTLPLSTLFRSPTIEHLAQCLREDHRLAFASSLVPVQPDGNRPPLYCVAGLDGGVMVFHKIATHLEPDQPVFGLEPPGMQGDKPVLLHVEDIAAHYVRELVEAQPNGPYHLAGYSFGGLVAFEMAIQLCRQGHQVGILALLDAENWQLAKQAPTKTRWGMTAAIYRVHLRQIVCGPDRWEFLRNKIGHRLLRLLYWYADKTNRPPSEQNRNIYDIQAFAGLTYRPGVYKGRLDLFRAEVQLSHEIADPLRGWGGLVDGEIVVHEIPGDHLSMNTGENLGILGAGLRGCLEQAGFDGRTQTSQPARIVDSTLTEVETQ